MTFFSASILLFLVMDPFGNVPFFLCILKNIPAEKKQKIIVREMLIALGLMVIFLLAGNILLKWLQISEPSLHIAGGIVLILIAIKMVFSTSDDIFHGDVKGDPLIVPLATPAVAGPSAIATVLILAAQAPDRWLEWLIALIIAWLGTGIILVVSANLDRLLGERVLGAIARLMGLLLTIIAVEMFLRGIRLFLGK